MPQNTTPQELIKKYLEGQCTPEEKNLVESWHLEDLRAEKDAPALQEITDVHEEMRRTIIAHSQNKSSALWPKIAAAASIFIALSVGSYLFFNKLTVPADLVVSKDEDILPSNKGVVLTISGGKKLVLNEQHTGVIQTADGAAASQSPEELVYSDSKATESALHTLSNNSGAKYKLKLADGTEILLDAASSITYPVSFSGNEREVSLSGQAYFKVAHNERSPFLVRTADQVIEDIGTEFNVNAYKNESVQLVTLIEGAVKVRRKSSSILLQPGEEVLSTSTTFERRPADLEETLSWLKGKQIFNHEPLENIMNQIARIYDVQLIWQDPATKQIEFGGSFDRTRKLSTVLNFLRKVGPGIDFEVDGKRVTILKKKNQQTQ